MELFVCLSLRFYNSRKRPKGKGIWASLIKHVPLNNFWNSPELSNWAHTCLQSSPTYGSLRNFSRLTVYSGAPELPYVS